LSLQTIGEFASQQQSTLQDSKEIVPLMKYYQKSVTCQPWLLLILSVATLIKDRTTQFLNAIKLTPAVTSRDSACIMFFKPTAKMVGMPSTNKEQITKQNFCQQIIKQ